MDPEAAAFSALLNEAARIVPEIVLCYDNRANIAQTKSEDEMIDKLELTSCR